MDVEANVINAVSNETILMWIQFYGSVIMALAFAIYAECSKNKFFNVLACVNGVWATFHAFEIIFK